MKMFKKEKPYETIAAFLITALSVWMIIAAIADIKNKANRDNTVSSAAEDAHYSNSTVIYIAAEDGTKYAFNVDVYEVPTEDGTPILSYQSAEEKQ